MTVGIIVAERALRACGTLNDEWHRDVGSGALPLIPVTAIALASSLCIGGAACQAESVSWIQRALLSVDQACRCANITGSHMVATTVTQPQFRCAQCNNCVALLPVLLPDP